MTFFAPTLAGFSSGEIAFLSRFLLEAELGEEFLVSNEVRARVLEAPRADGRPIDQLRLEVARAVGTEPRVRS